jgi:hypothetical protein
MRINGLSTNFHHIHLVTFYEDDMGLPFWEYPLGSSFRSLTVCKNNITDRKVFSFHSKTLLYFYFVLLLFLRWEDSSALYYGIQAICTYIFPGFEPRTAGTLSKQNPAPSLLNLWNTLTVSFQLFTL